MDDLFSFITGEWDDDDEWDDDEWDDDEWDDDEWDDFEELPLSIADLMQQAQEEEAEYLENVLNQYFTVKQLRQVAKRRGWQLTGTYKNDIVRQMQTHLLASREDPGLLAGLSDKERQLLGAAHTIFNVNGVIYREQWELVWRSILKQKEPVGPYVQELEAYGLIYECQDHGSDRHYHPLITLPEWAIPSQAIIPYGKATISPLKRNLPPAPPLLEQVERLIHYLAAGNELKWTPRVGDIKPEGHESPWIGNWPYLPEELTKLPAYSHYRALYGRYQFTVPVRHRLIDSSYHHVLGDAHALEWILNQLMALRVVIPDETDRLVLNPEAWNLLASIPHQELLTTFYRTWGVNFMDLLELRAVLTHVPNITVWRLAHPEIPYQALLAELVGGRQTLLRLLRGLAEDPTRQDEWFSLADFERDLCRLRPFLYHTMLSSEDWGFKHKEKTVNLETEGDWLKTIGQMVQSVITGPLYWLNAVDLRGSPDHIAAFRLTPTGRFLLSPLVEDTTLPPKTSPGEAIWLDARTVKISPGYEMAGLLGLMSRLGTAVPNEPFTYRLGAAGLENAFAAGETPDTLNRMFIESGWRLPDTGREYLEEVHRRFGHVHLYDDLTVIEFGDDMALSELRATGILDNCLVHEFSQRLIAIRPEMVETLLTRLEGRGYTPRLTTGASA